MNPLWDSLRLGIAVLPFLIGLATGAGLTFQGETFIKGIPPMERFALIVTGKHVVEWKPEDFEWTFFGFIGGVLWPLTWSLIAYHHFSSRRKRTLKYVLRHPQK